jgi:hypothetical protein
MEAIQFASWKDFREALFAYASQPQFRRDQFVFRGHATAEWPLQTTLDRGRKFDSDAQREEFVKRLLNEFRNEAMRLGRGASSLPTGDALELLARHHGLPSPLLDWSGSPYTAAFFAFDPAKACSTAPVAIWWLDRAKLPLDHNGMELIDDSLLLQFNVRALQ